MVSQLGTWAWAGMAAASSSSKAKTSGSSTFFLVIIAVFALVYFLVLRPQQKKAKAAREQGTAIEVGDEIVTVGGIVGRVLEMEGDRVTILSGGGEQQEGDSLGATPTRLVLVRQAIARKVPVPVEPDEDEDEDAHGEDPTEDPAEPAGGEASGEDEGDPDGPGGREKGSA